LTLLDTICDLNNLRDAFRQVKANKGKPGVDGQTIQEFGAHLKENLAELSQELKTGCYRPQPVRRVRETHVHRASPKVSHGNCERLASSAGGTQNNALSGKKMFNLAWGTCMNDCALISTLSALNVKRSSLILGGTVG